MNILCPICKKPVALTDPEMPFCSERCKLIDLGDWAMEKYRVPVEEDKDAPDAKGPDEESGVRD